MLLGVCLNKLEDPANALHAFEKACSLSPDDPTVLLNFAVFLAEHIKEMPNIELAQETFKKHEELYKREGKMDPQIDAQRKIIQELLRM